MEYWTLNKKTNTPGICGSVPPLSKLTGIKENKLNEHFSRKKEMEFNNDDWRICKVEPMRSKHQK